MGNVVAVIVRPSPRTLSQLVHLACLVAATSLAGLAAADPQLAQERAQVGMPAGWERLPGLTDVRYLGARPIGDQVRAGGATLDLPGLFTVRGAAMDRVTIGAGWISFLPKRPQGLNLDGSLGPAADTGASGARIDVLSGPQMRVPDNSSVLVLMSPEGLAIRWAPLSSPAGDALVEVLVDPVGDMKVQYLHLPDTIPRLIAAGDIQALDSQLRPTSASAFGPRLVRMPVATLPLPDPSAPRSTDPPPSGCVPAAGTWCDQADGPGTAEIYLNEDFNDGLSTSRGWSGSDLWHEIPFAICSPGATSNPGRSWYFGEDTTCEYLDSRTGSLFSATVGPISNGTVLQYQFRGGFEDVFETLDVYINGTLFLQTPQLPDSTQWYHWTNPLDLSAFAGQMITIEFRFTSDGSNAAFLGWMIDDVQVWNPNSGNVPCVINAGKNGNAACSDRVDTQWTFFENNYCQGCTYTFYVLVECGREMHMPFDDMEGADIQVTSMATGLPVPLRCVNGTALADAGLGPYRGLVADCCPGQPGNETWWGPAFDVTDNMGPGHVAWGFGMAQCGSTLEYDLAPCGNGNLVLTCDEIDGTGIGGCGGCGGVLPRMGPGELQTVDCSIQDPNGLCGLYRVDITSGGNLWNLFANCDGTNTPKFSIFHDCTEAWTAYNPLPELAIANLVTTLGCPALQVDFDIQNLGCKDQVGDVIVRLSSNCVPPETFDQVVPGPIAVGQTIHYSIPFSVACSPVRVQVAADPDNVIDECTENLTIASCRADRGVDSLATFTCGCTAQLVADAGADAAGCAGDRILLDASASSITPCANPQYRWTNSAGTVVQDWSATRTYSAQVAGCPGGQTYTLDVRCQGEGCIETDTVRLNCMTILPNAGPDVRVCVGDPVLLDGSASTIANCPQREFRWFNPAGNEARGWGTDPTLDLGGLTCANAGAYQVEVRCVGNPFCSEVDDVTVRCVNVVANAGPDLVTCDGDTFTITGAGSTRTNCTQSIYQWVDAASGNPVSAPSLSPDFTGSLSNCPGVATLALVAACNDAGFTTCGTFDFVDIVCPKPLPPVPTATPTCGRGSSLTCGAAEAGVTYSWDIDILVDTDADGDPANDQDIVGCDVAATWPTAASRIIRAWATEPMGGCPNFADITADSFEDPVAPVPTSTSVCLNTNTDLSCGPEDPSLAYSWDVDILVDSSGDAIPDNGADAAGCNTVQLYAAGSFDARVTATDGRNCVASATVRVDVLSPTSPGEVLGDRVSRAASAVTFSWISLVAATDYRIARGDIGSWYSHSADDAVGRGTCATGLVTTWTDPDDAGDSSDYYYLITAIGTCAAEGLPGDGWDGSAPTARPARLPSAGCP